MWFRIALKCGTSLDNLSACAFHMQNSLPPLLYMGLVGSGFEALNRLVHLPAVLLHKHSSASVGRQTILVSQNLAKVHDKISACLVSMLSTIDPIWFRTPAMAFDLDMLPYQ